MLPPKKSRKVLLKMFCKKYIANLDELFHLLDTHSRMSVFRRLKPLGYLSSFTDAGRYYTLPDIPKFDPLGLWFYQEVGFSRVGTLKSYRDRSCQFFGSRYDANRSIKSVEVASAQQFAQYAFWID